MTQAEFMHRLGMLHRRMRKVFFGGGAFVVAFNLAIYGYLFSAYPLSSLSHDPGGAVIHYSIGTVLSLVAVIILFFALRRTRERHTPRCPACGAGTAAQDVLSTPRKLDPGINRGLRAK
jgi:Na+/melibiose symporter-like transporter